MWGTVAKVAIRLAPLVLGAIGLGCGDEGSTEVPKEEPFEEPHPVDRNAPRNCRYTLTTYVEPQNICVIQNLDRLQLPYNWNEAGDEAEVAGIVDFASFPPAESDPKYNTVCGSADYFQYFGDCGRSRALSDARRFGRDLTQQQFWVPDLNPKDDIPEEHGSRGEELLLAGALQAGEETTMGPVWFAQGLFGFNNPDDRTVADITIDQETTVENKGRYEMSVNQFYMEGFPSSKIDGVETGCVPIEGRGVDLGGGQIFTIPSYMDGEPILLNQGLSCFFDDTSGAGSYEATCCEGDDCHPAKGITVDRVLQVLGTICDGQDASPQEGSSS